MDNASESTLPGPVVGHTLQHGARQILDNPMRQSSVLLQRRDVRCERTC